MKMKFSVKDRLKQYSSRNQEALKTRTAKVGSYSFIMSLVVLAILIAVNVLVETLPSKWTQFDISSAQLYSLTSDTKVVVTNLEEDVTIYWITQDGEEDSIVEKILDRYRDLSDHLSVVKKNPDQYPTFAEQYTDEEVSNNSLVVECGDKYRYISYDTIYTYNYASYSSTGSVSSAFDGEGAITSAIDYVISDELPKIYVLTGHGESDLSDALSSQIERDNMETEEFSLLNADEIPEDCDCILINSPTSDISEEEKNMLQEYVDKGGHLMVLSGPKEDSEMANLNSILSEYGVSVVDGIVIDSNRDFYAFSEMYILMPEIESSEITDPLTESGYHAIIPIAQGLSIDDSVDGVTVTSLLQTSGDSYSKLAGYDLTTYDKEDSDIDGPFSLGVSVEVSDTGGRLVWISSDYVTDDTYNSYSSGANLDLVMNSMSWMIGETEAVSIRTKSMDYSYLTISSNAASLLKLLMIGILPIGYLLFGIEELLRRRKMQ